ncbi:discoidin domain-containing protein [Paenibacillus sp. HB172176]|uniref:discoidin domain-containing protein n=1 Tax=Paenibacillus sp. HB172176 TaxID=2493690 RepID=UPI001439FB86|nr:discoidin domain-containing protein [Paenibacillus sp. HB172176]
MRSTKRKSMMNRVLVALMCCFMVFSTYTKHILPLVEAVPSESNVFLMPGVSVTASGSDSGKPQANAIDGDTVSNWVYNTGTTAPSELNPVWLKIDLGTEATISRFELKHAGSGGDSSLYNTKDYKIQVSDDDMAWNDVVSVTDSTYDASTHQLEEPVKARYIKLSITDVGAAKPDSTYEANVYEFEAYGHVNEEQAAESLLIEQDDEWRYLDDGSDQGTGWRELAFDDDAWQSGQAPLGYAGSGKGQDLNTIIGYGGDSGNKHITAYYRKSFQVEDADAIKQLKAVLVRDDGAAVYLNGQEIFRSNMPNGTIAYNTLASSAVADERDEIPFDIDPSLLVDGTNVIAAEVHQNAGSSSDTDFSLTLTGSTQEPAKNQGLLGQYYSGLGSGQDFGFGDWKTSAIDSQINFSNLDPVLEARTGSQDSSNVRWTGQILPETTGDYTFYMIGDNGFRLWVDDMSTPIIDFWQNVWDVEQTSETVHLAAGQKYQIRIDYFENNGGSNLYLKWSGPNVVKQVVPESAFFLPADYIGPTSGSVTTAGDHAALHFPVGLGALPDDLASHLTVKAGNDSYAAADVQLFAEDPSVLQVQFSKPVAPGAGVSLQYDGAANWKSGEGATINEFAFALANLSEYVDYSPIAAAMTLFKDAKTKRAFAWYSRYDMPDNAPANILDSIVELVPADQDFSSDAKIRVSGDSQILNNLKITNSTNGSFISHKVLVEELAPGMAYKYRVGADDNWSETGTFTTEAEDEKTFDFLYMTDSQGGNSQEYSVWGNTLRNALEDYPNAKFLMMTGDQVDAGALEYQWLDYFGKAKDSLIHLPVMAAVGNHEGPYNDNYYYHFNYPNDSIANPLPPGSVYAYDYGDAHFMVLNTMDIGWDDNQKKAFDQEVEWLKREVAQTDKKWKVVAFHKAIYSMGNHATDSDIQALRARMYPVFDELGIDVVLQGHDHTFMRSHQLYNNQVVTDIDTDGQGNPLNPDGTMYIVNNSAGTKFYELNNNANGFYADVFEQPHVAIYSGIHFTENSFTINSYKSGEDDPFDTYTIVRDDGKPNGVEELSAGKSGDESIAISWSKPADASAEDAIRGFRIYEVNGKLGHNWSVYVPATAGQVNYQYVVENADLDQSYDFAVRSVDKRDNSEAAIVTVDGNLTAAPTVPVVNDGFNTFGWTNVPGYDELSDYEFSVDGGETWTAVTANPQPVGDDEYEAGSVQVRVRADEETNREAGQPLLSDKPFTINGIHQTYTLSGELTRGDKLKVDVAVDPFADYSGEAYVVFELLDGKKPILINAIPIGQSELELSQYFNVSGSNYRVKVFVFDSFDGESDIPVNLSQTIELQ